MKQIILWLTLASLLPTGGCKCDQRSAAPRRSKPAVVVVEPDESGLPAAVPEREPNDLRSTAQPLSADKRVAGTIGPPGDGKAGDQDWFRVKAPGKPQMLVATLGGVPGVDLVLEAYGSQGKRLVKVNNNPAGGGEVLVNLAVDRQEVYLRVTAVGAGGGAKAGGTPYRIGYRLRQREEGEELEPNWKAELATPLYLDQGEAAGYLGWGTDNDWYRVQIPDDFPASSRIRLEYDGLDHVRANVSMRDSRGKVVQARWSRLGGGVTLANLVLPPGEKLFHVVVRCQKATNLESRYYLRVLASSPDVAVEAEPNDRPPLATALVLDQAARGQLGEPTDRDVYQVKVASIGLLRVEVTPPLDLDVALAVVDFNGKTLTEVNDGGRREREVITAWPVEPPVAYLRVRPMAGTATKVAPYKVKASVKDGAGQEQEPNNTQLFAQPWPQGDQLSGYMHPKKDVDYFSLTATAEELKLEGKPPAGLAMKIELLNQKGLMVANSKQDAAFGKVLLKSKVKQGAKYFLRISAPGASNPDHEYRVVLQQRGTP